MSPGDRGRDFDLAAGSFDSLSSVLRIGRGECHKQESHRLTVAAFVALRIGSEDSAQKDSVENEPGILALPAQRVGRRARPLPHSGARGGAVR